MVAILCYIVESRNDWVKLTHTNSENGKQIYESGYRRYVYMEFDLRYCLPVKKKEKNGGNILKL